jgi:hypothetical protein
MTPAMNIKRKGPMSVVQLTTGVVTNLRKPKPAKKSEAKVVLETMQALERTVQAKMSEMAETQMKIIEATLSKLADHKNQTDPTALQDMSAVMQECPADTLASSEGQSSPTKTKKTKAKKKKKSPQGDSETTEPSEVLAESLLSDRTSSRKEDPPLNSQPVNGLSLKDGESLSVIVEMRNGVCSAKPLTL